MSEVVPPPPPLPLSAQPTKYKKVTTVEAYEEEGDKQNYTLLVISADGNDWKGEFKGVSVEGKPLVVYNTSWARLHVESSGGELFYGKNNIICTFVEEDGNLVILSPNFILFRAFPNDLFGTTFRAKVLGLYFSRIGSVNSLESVLRSMDRPVVLAEMIKIQERVGKDKFPVISAKYHPNQYSGNKQRLIKMKFPTVIKVGSSYGGYGKIIAKSQGDYDDTVSLLALGTEYFTEEPLITHQYEFRIQVIGEYIRCYRRNSHNNWKNQCGHVFFEDHPWDDKYKIWVDEVRQMFNGMDMFGIDVLHKEEGVDYIIEINDYAMGFDSDYEVEDMKWVRELVVRRMTESILKTPQKSFVGEFVFSNYSRSARKK